MSALYVRNTARAWATAAGVANGIPFHDAINRDVDPAEPLWFTALFDAQSNNGQTFCFPGKYLENGMIDLVFAGVPGAGDEALLSKLEPTVAAFCQSVDLSGRLILGQYEPVEEILSGTADRWYRLTVAVQYVYHA